MNITGDQRIIDAMRAFLDRQAFANEWFTVVRIKFDRGGGSTCLLLGPGKANAANTIAVIVDGDTPEQGAIPHETLMVYHPATCPKRFISRGRNLIRTLSRWGIEFPDGVLSHVSYRASNDLPPEDLRYTPLGPLGLAALRAALSTTVVES